MYSSYWKPKDGRGSNILTDHEALHRDEATHKSIQSDEAQLRPLDLETIMSSKAAVKFWYLHRPKTMAYVHKNAVKIQSVGKAFAVRALIKKYGIGYAVELAKQDAKKKLKEKLAEMSEEERLKADKEQAEYEALVAETRRLKREQAMIEEAEEQARLMRESEVAELARIAAEETRRIEEEKARHAQEMRKRREEEAAATAAKEAACIAAEKEAKEEAERQREASKLIAKREREEYESGLAHAALVAQIASEEKEQARIAKIEADKAEKYEQSLSKDVPVVVRNHGNGRIVSYDKDSDCYRVQFDDGLQINVDGDDVDLDDDRILSPRTIVDTPFGVGEVVGLDPHVGCYAINTEINAPEGEQFLAFVQILDVAVHVEEEEEKAIVEDEAMPIPDEIGLVAARIVDSRIVHKTGKKFIQYKLEIKTSNYGIVYCWKRYSTFRTLCERLNKEAGFKKKDIPELPKRHILGNFSQKTISERAEKLNLFLTAAVKAEHLQWGIRVDDNIAVYKRRIKRHLFSRRN